jgi:hypothetical protein
VILGVDSAQLFQLAILSGRQRQHGVTLTI